jgi:hypothetical protein
MVDGGIALEARQPGRRDRWTHENGAAFGGRPRRSGVELVVREGPPGGGGRQWAEVKVTGL